MTTDVLLYHRRTSEIRALNLIKIPLNLVSSCSCFCPIHRSQMLSRQWRCNVSSADRRCSNWWYIGDTFSSNDRTSCIDHFVLSDVLLHSVDKCYVEESPLNPSDHNHAIIDLKYDLQIAYAKPRNHGKSGIAWHKVDSSNISEYQTGLDKEPDDICVATGTFLCENTNCQNANHKRDNDDLCDKMIQVCLKSRDLCFPKSKPYTPCKAGWNFEVKLLREDLFWHHIWVDCRRPPLEH